MLRFNLYLLLLFTSFSLMAQEKKEYEKRIPKTEFPAQALELLNPYMANAKRLRFYKEFDGKNESYEAKFKMDKQWFSVEFYAEGMLQDIEMKVKFKHLPDAVSQKISNYFKEQYDRWKIEKTQLQYQDITVLLSNSHVENFNGLEIILATKTNGKLTKYELNFDSEGNFISKRKVVRRSYDFLLF